MMASPFLSVQAPASLSLFSKNVAIAISALSEGLHYSFSKGSTGWSGSQRWDMGQLKG
jgi:hypothetical protein